MKTQQNVGGGRRPVVAVLSSLAFGACLVAAIAGLISGTGPLGHGPASAASPGGAVAPVNAVPATKSPEELPIAPASVEDPIDPQKLNYVDIQG